MGIADQLRRLFGRATPAESEPKPFAAPGLSQAEAAAWLEAFESGRLNMPSDVHDAAGWDRYWTAQWQHGGLEQGFGDMMASDPSFISRLRRRGARSILCAGNGLSSESLVLALHGFDVIVLDLSTIPKAVFAGIVADASHPFHRGCAFTMRGDAAVTLSDAAPVDPTICPPMHRSDGENLRGGGSLSYQTGDLRNREHCPGPFDVVIERRTLQLFPAAERSAALDGLAARLAPGGLLVSHHHAGSWKPPEPRTHFAAEWATPRGFLRHENAESPASQSAWLIYSSG